jgi:hypothetical protein
VVQVPVSEQDGNRSELVLGEHVVEQVLCTDARVDHDALLAAVGRDHPAVGLERTSREADDEHEDPFRRPSGQPIGRSFRLSFRLLDPPA